MRILVEPPLFIAGQRIRAIVAIDVTATPLPFGGLATRGEKRPLAIMIGTGAEARLIAIDGAASDPD